MSVTRIGRPSTASRGARSRSYAVLVPVVLVVTALVTTGCGNPFDQPVVTPSQAPTTIASPTPSGSASPDPSASPSPSAPEVIEFRTDGAGPYLLGRTLTELNSGPGLDQVGPLTGCPGNTTARGTGVWQDVYLSFRSDGRLYLLTNRSLSIPTPSGAYLGFTLTQLRTIYASITTKYELPQGNPNPSAFLVQTLSGGGILFELNEADQITAMHAGQGTYLRTTYSPGQPLC